MLARLIPSTRPVKEIRCQLWLPGCNFSGCQGLGIALKSSEGGPNMPVLRSERYDSFENDTARDAFRGMPLQQFPWLLETSEFKTAQGELLWNVQISCLNATPSGFGSKLNFSLLARAELNPDSIAKNIFDAGGNARVNLLFSGDMFNVCEKGQMTCEGLLEDLPKLAKDFHKEFHQRLTASWSVEKVKASLRQKLRKSSPGGFGESLS